MKLPLFALVGYITIINAQIPTPSVANSNLTDGVPYITGNTALPTDVPALVSTINSQVSWIQSALGAATTTTNSSASTSTSIPNFSSGAKVVTIRDFEMVFIVGSLGALWTFF